MALQLPNQGARKEVDHTEGLGCHSYEDLGLGQAHSYADGAYMGVVLGRRQADLGNDNQELVVPLSQVGIADTDLGGSQLGIVFDWHSFVLVE